MSRPRRSLVVASYADAESSSDGESLNTSSRVPNKRGRDPRNDGDSDSDATQQTRKVKRKTSRKKTKVDFTTKLPVDAVLEILGHVDVVSLLSVRKTSKSMYRLLTDNAESVWAQALERAGLPELESSFVKPWQYAEMVLVKKCTRCGSTQFIPDFWVMRRSCRKCRTAGMIRLEHHKKHYPDAHPSTRLCVLESRYKPARLTDRISSHFAFRDDFEALDTYLWTLQSQDDADGSLRTKTSRGRGSAAAAPSKGTSRVAQFVEERQSAKKVLLEKDVAALMKRFDNETCKFGSVSE